MFNTAFTQIFTSCNKDPTRIVKIPKIFNKT